MRFSLTVDERTHRLLQDLDRITEGGVGCGAGESIRSACARASATAGNPFLDLEVGTAAPGDAPAASAIASMFHVLDRTLTDHRQPSSMSCSRQTSGSSGCGGAFGAMPWADPLCSSRTAPSISPAPGVSTTRRISTLRSPARRPCTFHLPRRKALNSELATTPP